MTQENKELLLKDLCARLPYGVKASYYGVEEERETLGELDCITRDGYVDIGQFSSIERIKPYLFPMSSITEQQKQYINNKWGVNENFDFRIYPNWGDFVIELGDVVDFINWCYENHFDINGLIPKDLAIDATGLNIY